MNMGFMAAAVPLLLPGFGITVAVSLLALVPATALGIVLGGVRATVSARNPMAWLIDAQVAVVRGTPIIVQIFAAYFLLPEMNIRLPPFWVGTVALAFNSMGYQSEIARAAIQSVGVGQYDAAASLGLGRPKALRLVIAPQAFRQMLPGLINEASQLIKASSVLSVIAVFELHKAAGAIIGNSFRFLEVLTVEALFYLTLVSGLTALADRAGRYFVPGSLGPDTGQVR